MPMCAHVASVSGKKRVKAALVFMKTIEEKTIRPWPGDVMMCGHWARGVGQYRLYRCWVRAVNFGTRERKSILEPGEKRGPAAPQRPRSTPTSARPQVNRDERAAKLRSILQPSEEITDGLFAEGYMGAQVRLHPQGDQIKRLISLLIELLSPESSIPPKDAIYMTAQKYVASIPRSKRNIELDYGRSNFLTVSLRPTYIGATYRTTEETPWRLIGAAAVLPTGFIAAAGGASAARGPTLRRAMKGYTSNFEDS
ncbi:hypothetical protein EVAR_59227_1 [Eumeta japonica]|uniref:Uncharacterized protein n=1 Tax=Eumeta variegata TaxID=151549 RepID=A0A4C1ZDD8_EUMVA|nr:hypothetical protein EVAR_59227_1 [Eumeta japonica]